MLSGRNIKKKRLCTPHTLLMPLNHSINEREFIQKQQKNMHNVKETETVCCPVSQASHIWRGLEMEIDREVEWSVL